MRSHDLLFAYSSACRISSLVARQSRRFEKRFLLPILSVLVLWCSSLAGVASAGVNAWTTNGPEGGLIQALAIDPSNPATLYAGTFSSGVFKSTNGGASWTAINTGLTSTFAIHALVIDPTTPATLYAGTGCACSGDASGVFKSTNGGASWTAINTGLTRTNVFALAIDPSSPSTLYASAYGGGVFKSTNGGASWSAINAGLNIYFVFSALAIDPSAPTTLYAGSGRDVEFGFGSGVFKSTNGGGSWSAINAGLTNSSVYALAIDPTNPATLYAGTLGGVFKSTNAGGNWSAINTGLTSTDVSALAIHPSAPATLYAGTSGGGVFGSTDSGGTWAAANAGLPHLAVGALAFDPTGMTTLYAGLSNGVWQLSSPPSGTVSLLPTSAHSGGAHGAFYTTNVSVANGGAVLAAFTLKFLGHDQDGSGGPEQTFNLEAGKSVTYFDVLGSVFNESSNFGAIRITSATPSLNIVSVTSTHGFGGTMSQTIPVVSSSNLIPAGSSRSILYIREGDGFRTNLVLASNATVSTTVDVSLVTPAGTTLATTSYSVPPNGMTQINRVVRDMGVSGAITGARLALSSSTPGAAFTGFASVIDETTNDPTTVEAK